MLLPGQSVRDQLAFDPFEVLPHEDFGGRLMMVFLNSPRCRVKLQEFERELGLPETPESIHLGRKDDPVGHRFTSLPALNL